MVIGLALPASSYSFMTIWPFMQGENGFFNEFSNFLKFQPE